MSRLAKKFDETGSIEDAPRTGRPVTVRTKHVRGPRFFGPGPGRFFSE